MNKLMPNYGQNDLEEMNVLNEKPKPAMVETGDDANQNLKNAGVGFERAVNDNIKSLTEEVTKQIDTDPVVRPGYKDSLGRNVIEYKNGTKVIQDTKNNTQELIGKDGSWLQYSKESGEWKKIDEGRYQEVTTESGDKYSQIDHVKDGKIIKTTRIYEHGKIVEDVVGGNKVKPEDLQKIDMPETKNEVKKEEIKNEEYFDGGEMVVDGDTEKKAPYGEIIDQSVEKGPADMPEIKDVKVENVQQKMTEEDVRNMMKKENITSQELFAYMDKNGIPQNNSDGSRKLWSEFTVEEQYAITQGVLEERKLSDVSKVEEIKQTEGELSEKLDDGSVKLKTEEEKAEVKQEIEGVKEDEMTGKVDSGLTEMVKDLPQVEQKTDTVVNQSVPVEEGKFERVEMQNLPEQAEKPLTLEEKQKNFLKETINDLSYLDINNASREQNGLVINSIQVSIEGAGELNLSESQKQNLYRTVDLLRYPNDETLGKYQFNDEADRKNVADLVRIKNPSLADRILQEGKLATNNKAEKTSFDAGQNGIDSTKEFDPIQGNVEIYMRNNGLKPDNCYVLPDGTWMVNGKNLGSRVFYNETGLQQVGVSYDDFVKYYNK
ncbi:MAG: hypothetical protein ACOZAR_00420 [Patescibacteria group bacterium]